MKKLLLTPALLISAFCYSQKYFEIDLSKSNFDEQTIDLNYSGILLKNTLPKTIYTVKITVVKELDFNSKGETVTENDSKCDKDNPNIRTLFNELKGAEDELILSNKISELTDSIDKLKKGECKDSYLNELKSELINTQRKDLFYFKLEKNQNIMIQIDRLKDDGTSVKTWSIVLQTPREANYISHFGFTFSPNWIKTGDLYFSKQSGSNISGTDSFTIKKLNDNGKDFWKDLSLTANFLIPSKKLICTGKRFEYRFAWLAGFGIGGDSRFCVFTGPSILLNDFVALGLVGGVNYAYKLRGEYEANQGLSESLTFDQLHYRGIRPDIMISLSFRLSKEQLQASMKNIGGN